jgi:zinc-ribbon domain
MVYCSSCGQPSTPLARICTSCGTSVARKSLVPLSAAQSSTSITQVVTIKPKHGGMLAFEGFVLSFVTSLPGGLALSSGRDNPDVGLWWSGIALAIGAAYIALSLMKWNQERDKVNREDLAWIVAGLLGCASVSGFIL